MLVKAKWNVKDATGWHKAGQVFETGEDLGDAVIVLNAPKKREQTEKPVKTPEEVKTEPEKEEKPRSAARRRAGK